MQGIWALEGQLPQHKYLQLRVGEKVDRIRISTPQQILKISIFFYSALPEWGSDSNTDFDIFIEQVHYFEKCGIENYHGVKGRLAKHAKYWEKWVLATLY
jgi:hypothetical protein